MTGFIQQLDVKIVLGITVLKIKKPDCRPRPSWWAQSSGHSSHLGVTEFVAVLNLKAIMQSSYLKNDS